MIHLYLIDLTDEKLNGIYIMNVLRENYTNLNIVGMISNESILDFENLLGFN